MLITRIIKDIMHKILIRELTIKDHKAPTTFIKTLIILLMLEILCLALEELKINKM